VIVHVPLAIVPYRSHWYLVSMLGDQANWVRNVQAGAGDAVLLHGGHRIEEPADRRMITRTIERHRAIHTLLDAGRNRT
jgi:hypothetical protein